MIYKHYQNAFVAIFESSNNLIKYSSVFREIMFFLKGRLEFGATELTDLYMSTIYDTY